MVKADPKRNYYADLEVAPDADAEEIRKQFRKLALKWHPDRNPGREQECVPRFQAIQAAHEILGDPGERQRYDLERRKRGGGGGTGTYTPRQPAPRGNPYQATSNFPPPPRRTGGGRAQPPPRPDYANPHASTGANRYANFPKPPPTQRKEYAAEQKANVFNAWQNMKTKPNAHAGQAESSHQRAKSAWEFAQEQKPGVNRSQSTRMPKRGGFDPTTPGADEPPAASTSSYFTTSNYGRPVPPPPPPPRDAGATRPQQHADPLRQFKEQFTNEVTYPEGMRTRTPYNASGGEKIFVDPVRRSASQRSSPHREPESANAGAHGAAGARHHSASPPRRKGNATRPFSMYSSSEDEEPPTHNRQPSQSHKQESAGANGYPTQNGATNGSNTSNVNGGMGQKSKSSIFDFPIDADTFAQTNAEQFKSKSTESINTKFSPGDWHGKFQGSPDYFTGPVPPPGNRAKKSPSRPPSVRKNSTQNYTSATSQMPQPSPQPTEQPPTEQSTTEQPTASISSADPPPGSAGNPPPGKFSSEEWVKMFKDSTFVLPTDPPAKSASPTRGPPPMRGRKQSKSRPNGPNVKPKSATVADIDDDGSGSAESANEAAAADSSAMDIDPTPPASQTNGAQRPKIVPTPISQARAAQQAQAQAQAQAQQQDADDTFRFNEFANVAPFASTSQEGLRNMNDLTQNLPFESRPAAVHPTRPSDPAVLRLPEMPKAPELPQRLTMGVWAEHLPKMAAYVRAFHLFDSHMLQHFAARQQETDAMGTPVNWLGAIGDTMSGGFGSYMRGIKEDERARMHWNVAWEKHKATMELFEGCRARVLKGGLPA